MTDCSFVRSGLQTATLEFCSGGHRHLPTYIQPSITAVTQTSVEVCHHFTFKWNGFEPYPASDRSPTLLIVFPKILAGERKKGKDGVYFSWSTQALNHFSVCHFFRL